MANLLQNNSKLQLTDKETERSKTFSSWALAETSFCTSRPLFLFYKHWVSLNPSKEVPPLKPFLSIRKASRNSESSIVLLSPHSSWSFLLLELPPVSLFCNFLGTECWVKENILHYSREPVLMRKPKLHIFHSHRLPFQFDTISQLSALFTNLCTFRHVSHCPDFQGIQCEILFSWQLRTVVGGASRFCFTVSLPIITVHPESKVTVLPSHAL